MVEESEYFDIEVGTGVIYVKNKLAPLSSKQISLNVQVQDGGVVPFKAYTKVKVGALADITVAYTNTI